VSEVKGTMRDELIASGAAIRYSEPEKLVMSRSGDECVVALTDQWYLTYGEDEWLAATRQARVPGPACNPGNDLHMRLDTMVPLKTDRSLAGLMRV